MPLTEFPTKNIFKQNLILKPGAFSKDLTFLNRFQSKTKPSDMIIDVWSPRMITWNAYVWK